MNDTEKRTIRNVVEALRGGRATDEVRAALTGPCRLYLETWVIPALELLIKEDRTLGDLKLAEETSR